MKKKRALKSSLLIARPSDKFNALDRQESFEKKEGPKTLKLTYV